jgi:hypothetical protein
MTASGCNVLRQDTAAVTDPEAGIWGNIECASDSRYAYVGGGGDTSPMPAARPKDTARTVE